MLRVLTPPNLRGRRSVAAFRNQLLKCRIGVTIPIAEVINRHSEDHVTTSIDAATEQFAGRAAWGCLLVNSLIEFGGVEETVARNGALHLERLRRVLLATPERAADHGEIPRENRGKKVNLVLGVMLGIIAPAQAGVPRKELESLHEAARSQIIAWKSFDCSG